MMRRRGRGDTALCGKEKDMFYCILKRVAVVMGLAFSAEIPYLHSLKTVSEGSNVGLWYNKSPAAPLRSIRVSRCELSGAKAPSGMSKNGDL